MKTFYQPIIKLTQTQVDAGATNAPAGAKILVIDGAGAFTGQAYEKTSTTVIAAGGIKNNLAATIPPTANEDSGDGYAIGSRWIDIINDESYICVDATVGQAVWSKTTVGTIDEVAGLQTALDTKSATTHNHDTAYTAIAHGTNTLNPHSVTATQVGLGNASNTSDANKPVSTAQQTALDLKVDKVTGKQLSTNDYTTAEQTKLSGIASGAEVNLQPDWNQVTTTEDDFIKNKPTIPAAVTVNNTLTSTSTTEALSAAQGKALQDSKQELYEGTVALRTPNNLTSNTSDPNYILTSSSEHTVHLFYRAFDNNDANHWYTAGTSVATGTIELNYKIRPTNLLLRGETTILEYWTRWQLQGSKDGTNWDTLVDRSGVDEVIQNTSKNFSIITSKEYKYFRFNGLAAVGTNIPLSRLEISGVEASRHTASVKVTRSTAQSLSSAGTIVSWDTVDHEVGATTLWDVANPTRLTAPVAGTYLIVADIAAESDSIGQIAILKNGTVVHNGTAPRFWTGSGSTSALVRLAIGDYVECRVTPATTVNSIVAAERHYLAMVFVSL